MQYIFDNQYPTPQATIFHLDMNAYFASVEQACNPFIRDKPVAVVHSPNYTGAAILARSYQAKNAGVKNFSRLYQARIICPDLVAVPADYLKYYDINQKIYQILKTYTAKIEIYSIDEFFLDLTTYFRYHKKSISELALEFKQRIATEIHPILTCSIGVGANKLLAKVGSDFQKPDGLTIINWSERKKYLDQMQLEDIWGIGRHCLAKLEKIGIKNTADIRTLSPIDLAKMVGSYGQRLLELANGIYYDQVDFGDKPTKAAKSMQHAHTLSTATKNPQELHTLLHKLVEKLAKRLRKHKQLANIVTLGIRPSNQKHYGWGYYPKFYQEKYLSNSTNYGKYIYQNALELLTKINPGNNIEVRLLVVGVKNLVPDVQQNLWQQNSKLTNLYQAIDKINNRYGEFTIRNSDLVRQKAKERELSAPRKYMTFHPDS